MGQEATVENAERTMLDRVVSGIAEVLGGRLRQIVLFGSTARGTDGEDSDVDIAVIMDGEMDFEDEDRLMDFVVDMDLEYDKVFSVIDIDQKKFMTWKQNMPFYRNIEKEGTVLWKAV